MGKKFAGLKKNVNFMTKNMLLGVRQKIKKDFELFKKCKFREDELLTISNHRLES